MKLNRRQLRKIISEIFLREGDHGGSKKNNHDKDYHSAHAKEVASKHGDDHHVEDVTPKIQISDFDSIADSLTSAYLSSGGFTKRLPSFKADFLSLKLGNQTFNFGAKYDKKFKISSSLELVSDDHGKHFVLTIDGIPEALHLNIRDYNNGNHDDHEGKAEHAEDINVGLHGAIKSGDINFTLGGHAGVMSILDNHPHFSVEGTATYQFDKSSKEKRRKVLDSYVTAEEELEKERRSAGTPYPYRSPYLKKHYGEK